MKNKQPFSKLFEPARIGTMELKNRVVMVPLMTNFADEQGYVTQRLTDYYEERAKGGAGLIIVEAACIELPLGRGLPRQLAISDDRFVSGLSDRAAAIGALMLGTPGHINLGVADKARQGTADEGAGVAGG